MKLLTIMFALIFSSQVFAINIDTFCDQFTWENEKIDCYKVAGRNFIDSKALDICNGMSFDSDKMNCLKAILNRSYTSGEARTCSNQSFDSEKMKCLGQLGTVVDQQQPGDNRKLESIRKLTITAQDFLRRNDVYSAQRTLDQIYQLTTTP